MTSLGALPDSAPQRCYGGACKAEIQIDAGGRAPPVGEQLRRGGWVLVRGKPYCAHCAARMSGQEELKL